MARPRPFTSTYHPKSARLKERHGYSASLEGALKRAILRMHQERLEWVQIHDRHGNEKASVMLGWTPNEYHVIVR
jgi:hypothetical protein